MSKSTTKKRPGKSAALPPKPHDDYPLTPHAGGMWQKKINGKVWYFYRWGRTVNGKLERLPDLGAPLALELYQAQIDDILAGRQPRAKIVNGKVVHEAAGLTVKLLCDAFYEAKKRKHEAREMTARMLGEYDATCRRVVSTFGRERMVDDLTAADFAKLRAKIAQQYGPVRIANEVTKVRGIFKWALENGLIKHAVPYGSEFVKPSKKVLRLHRANRGKRLFSAAELMLLLNGDGKQIDPASATMRAMILLGINCGFGNADCGTLPLGALDLDGGWVDYARPKTGIARKAKLWAETVEAIRIAFGERPPKGELAFVTKYGQAWSSDGNSDAVTHEFGKRMKACGLNGHRGFYCLRHCFRTVSDSTRDFPAVRLVMGHADSSIDDTYREGIEDSRLVAVAEHVRQWLFANPVEGGAV